QGHDAALAAGDRPPLRRQGPHHRAARRAQDRGADRLRQYAGAGAGAAETPHRRPDQLTRCELGKAGANMPPTRPGGLPSGRFRFRVYFHFARALLAGASAHPLQIPACGILRAMRAILERSNLLKSLNHVHRVVERRNTIPILSNVLLSASGASLEMKATDLDLEVTEATAANIEQSGSTTVPAHLLYDIVRKLPDGAEVMLK